MRLLSNLALAWLAALLALWGAVDANLIGGWGRWYNPSIPYRQQTDALMAGRVALSESPTALAHDYAWGAGTVQQVWGLGVPAWRMPFEAAARIFGQSGFPDRIAVTAAWALTIYLVMLAMFSPVEPGVSWMGHLARHPERIAMAGMLAFYPPILFLANGEFRIYEEPVFYGYLYSIGLFASLIAFLRRPHFPALLALTALSGIATFFRPTMGAYGFATTILACAMTRRYRWPWWQTLAGLALFGVGGAALYLSNKQRFGSGTEFGHTLNQTLEDLIFTARFGGPYDHEPLWPAFKELIGSIFFVLNHTNEQVRYINDLVLWQTPTPRWRENYKATFDIFALCALLFCWGRGLWSGVAAAVRRKLDAWDTEVMVTSAWSLISFLPLCAFYLHFHAVSSRYWDDFAPSLAVAAAGCFAMKWRGGILAQAARFVALGVFVGWWHWEVTATQTQRFADATGYSSAVNNAGRIGRRVYNNALPTSYRSGGNQLYGIFRNGVGWESGPNAPAYYQVTLFFDSPQRLALEVAPAAGRSVSDGDYKAIKAKVGLEFLKLNSMKDTPNGRLLSFDGPKKEAYRHGPQMISIGLIPPKGFMSESVPFRLLQVTTEENP